MATDFTNTQTGGVGATPQVGDKPTESSDIKKTPGRIANVSNEPTETVNTEKPSPTKEGETPSAENNNQPIPEIPVEPQQNIVEDVVGEEQEQEIPLIAPIRDEPKEEEGMSFDFFIPDNEIVEGDLYDKSQATFGIPGNDDLPEGDYSEDVVGVANGEPEKKGDTYTYPGSDKEYKIVDGYWHEKTKDAKEWSRSSRGTSFALNDYYSRKGVINERAKVPERTYPKKGGIEFEGIQVYGNPYQEGTAYTVHNGAWYKVDKGGKDWVVVDSDRTISALNKYHGTDIETSAKRKARGATDAPGTVLKDGDSLPQSTRDISKDIESAGVTTPQPISNTEQLGDILLSRGAEEGDDKTSIGVDETGYSNKMYSTGTDALFGTPPRPTRERYKDDIGYNMAVIEWDKKYGAVMPASGDNVVAAEKKKQELIQDRDTELQRILDNGHDVNSKQYMAAADDFRALINDADENIELAKQGLETQNRSFQNRMQYIQSEQYELDKKNSPYAKIAEIQENLASMYHNMNTEQGYNEYIKEQGDAYAKTLLLNDQIERDKLSNFVQQDIDVVYKDSNLTDSQKAQLKMAQARAKEVIEKGAMPGVAERIVQETYTFMETTKEINNRLSEANNRGMQLTDVLLENKKVFLEENREILGEETVKLFESTMKMRDFASDYIESGKIKIDPVSGAYSISENVSDAEREYIDTRIGELINNYKVAKSEIYSNNRKVIEEKSQQKKSMEAAIAKAEKAMRDSDMSKDQELIDRINSYKDKVRELGYEIKELKTGENTFFMNDPNHIALDVSSNSTLSARQLYQSIPDGISAKDRFDIFYEALIKKNEALKKQYGISENYLDRVGEKTRDILDWEYLNVKLTPQEIEYYKNEATIRQLSALYLNNDWGITEESSGFWAAFDNALTGTFAPNTSAANGFYNETDAAITMSRVLPQVGLSESDLADGMSLDRLNERIDIDFLSMESGGSMLGTTTSIMFALMGSGQAVSGATGFAKNIYRLIDKYKDFDRITDAARDFERVGKAFKRTMGETKLGKYFYETGKQGIEFQYAGMIFNQDEELNFASGMGGAMAGKMFEGIFKNMSPSKMVEFVGDMFGASTGKAVDVFKRMGAFLAIPKNMHYRGLGEMPEEFAQELIGIYRGELEGRGFWETVNERYFSGKEGLSNLGELLVSSYVLGAGMGVGTSSTQNDMWNDLPPGERSVVEQIIKDQYKDFAIGNANADIAAERIVNNIEAVMAQQKTEKDAVQEQKTAEMDVSEQTRNGEGMVEGDQTTEEKKPTESIERITADSIEKAEELYNQGYRPTDGDRINESASLAEIRNTWINGRDVEMAKVVTDGDASTETTETTEEAKVISLADRIRSLKPEIQSDFEAETKTANPEEAADLWRQGYAPMIDGKPQYGLTQDEVSQMAAEGEIDMVKPKPMAASIIPNSVIRGAIEFTAKGVEAVEKFIAEVKKQEWYQKLKNDPKKLAEADAVLEQLRADAENTQARSDSPSLEEHSENITGAMSEVENESFNETLGKGAAAAVKKGYQPDAEPMLIETDKGVTAIYETENGIFGVRVNRKKDGSLGKTTTVLDEDASFKEMSEAKKKLTPKRVKPTEGVKTIKDKIAQFKAGYKKGVAEGKKLTAEEKKAKQEEINEVQEQLVDYAKEVLPKKGYSKAEVTAAMNKIRNAKTPTKLEGALDWIDNKAGEFKENLRQESAERIIETFNDPLTKKRGDKKVSKISVDSRNKLEELANETGGKEAIRNMTQEQLNELEEKVDEIISQGVSEVRAKEEAKKEEKRKERDVVFRVLSEQNGAEKITLSGESEVADFFKGKKGAISYDGRLFASKSAFDSHLNKTGKTYESIGNIEATYSGDVNEAQRNYIENTPFRVRAARSIYDPIQSAARTLESRLMDVTRGSKELRTWTEENITKAVNKAFIQRDNGRQERLKIIQDKITDLFGSSFLGGMPKELVADSGIKIGAPKGGMSLNNDQAVNIHTMAQVDATPIYKFGDQLFDSEAKANEYAKNSIPKPPKDSSEEVMNKYREDVKAALESIGTVTSEYNPQVLRQISTDGSIESGLAKIQEINNYINGNEKLSELSDFFLNNFYVSGKSRYASTFELIYDKEMKEGPYVPMTRSIDLDKETSLEKLLGDGKKSAASAMSNHLKSRYNNSSAKFDFSKGAYSKALEYTNTMEHAVAFLPVAESMRNLVNSATKPQIISKIGKTRTQQLENHMNDIISDGGNLTGDIDGSSYNVLNGLLKYKVVTTLMLKLGSIPKQMTSATHFIGAGIRDGVSPIKVMLEMAKFIPDENMSVNLSKDEMDVIKSIFSSAFVKDRVSGKDIDFELRKMYNHMNNGKLKNAQNIVTKFLMSPTIMGDMAGVLMGGVPYTLAQYNHNVNTKNMSHKEAMADAIEKFTMTANETQQSTRRDILSNAQTSMAMRMFFTFKTSQIAAMSRLIKGAKVLTDTKGEYSGLEKAQAAYDITYYTVAQALFVAVANGTYGMMFGEDNDDDERAEERKRTAIYNLVMDTASSNLQGLGIPGMFVDFSLNNLRNRNVFNNLPVLDMVEDLTSGSSSMIRVLADGGNPTKDVSNSEYKNFMNVLGLKNIITNAEALKQLGEGEINAWDAVMGRTMSKNKDTGETHKFYTGEEREDWLYGKWVELFYGDETPKVDNALWGEEAENMSPSAQDLAPSAQDLAPDTFIDVYGKEEVSNVPYTSTDAEVERKYRNKEEIEMRKRAEASKENPEKRTSASGAGASEKSKSESQIREERISSWANKYEEIFGEKPPKGMPVSKIMDAVVAGKKQ